jgi:hypothetical protein
MRNSPRGRADFEWLQLGDHFCHFFHTSDEISEVLVPYYKIGLERRESCLWIATDRSELARGNDELRAALPDYDRRAAGGQIEIVSQDEWNTRYGALNAEEVIRCLLTRKDEALASGYTGLRIGGHLSTLQQKSPDAFLAFERTGDEAYRGQPIVALCSYCLANWTGRGILDALDRHAFGLAKLRGRWRPVEAWRPDRLAAGAPRARERWRSGLHDRAGVAFAGETELADLLDEHLGVHMLAYPGRITLEGGRVVLEAPQAARLRVALRELTANALASGAFAVPQAGLAVQWHVSANGSRRLHLTWAEHGLSGLLIPDIPGRTSYLIATAVEKYTRISEPGEMRWTLELTL